MDNKRQQPDINSIASLRARLRTLAIKMLPFIVGLLSLAAIAFSSTTAKAPIVRVKNGTLEGVHAPAYHQDYFLGIPYAQPPVNNLRFRQSQSLNTSWPGVRAAKEFQKLCVGYGVRFDPFSRLHND